MRQAARPPVAAGTFYDGDPRRLAADVKGLLAGAVPPRGARPIALVAPHAATSSRVRSPPTPSGRSRDTATTVVVLLARSTPPPSSRAPRSSSAAASARRWAWRKWTARRPRPARGGRRMHVRSVPARARALDRGPGPVRPGGPAGCADPARGRGSRGPGGVRPAGEALARVLADRRALIVASSDLSHYPAHEAAVASDRAVLSAMAGLDPEALRRTVAARWTRGTAGSTRAPADSRPCSVALSAARTLGATQASCEPCQQRATRFGDAERVVGYGAILFTAVRPASISRPSTRRRTWPRRITDRS